MKYLTGVALLATLGLGLALPTNSYAQTASPTTTSPQEALNAALQQVIALLIQEVQQLQAQLALQQGLAGVSDPLVINTSSTSITIPSSTGQNPILITIDQRPIVTPQPPTPSLGSVSTEPIEAGWSEGNGSFGAGSGKGLILGATIEQDPYNTSTILVIFDAGGLLDGATFTINGHDFSLPIKTNRNGYSEARMSIPLVDAGITQPGEYPYDATVTSGVMTATKSHELVADTVSTVTIQ